MKFTIEFDPRDPKNAATLAAIAKAISNDPFVVNVERETPLTVKDIEAIRDAVEGDGPIVVARAYGETSEDRARRTKVEMEQDKEIEDLFERVKHLPGMPKAIPTDLAADKLLDDLREAESKLPEEDDGFEVDQPLDIDEFRAILNKAMKALGGKAVGQIMAPHKSATDVPEDDRRGYADKLEEAM